MSLSPIYSGTVCTVLFPALLLLFAKEVALEKCRSIVAADVRFSLTTQRNTTGHRIIQMSWDSRPVSAGSSGRSQLEMKHFPYMCSDGTESVLIMTTIYVPPARLEREDFEVFSGLGHYKYHTKAATWSEAYQTCVREGAHLIIINSEAEANVARQFLARKYKVEGASSLVFTWSGFHDRGVEGQYITVQGYPLNESGYTKWSPGDPNNFPIGVESDEDCGAISAAGLLVDAPCLYNLTFICEQLRI